MDGDDGLMLNFAPATTGGAGPSSSRQRQAAARAQMRNGRGKGPQRQQQAASRPVQQQQQQPQQPSRPVTNGAVSAAPLPPPPPPPPAKRPRPSEPSQAANNVDGSNKRQARPAPAATANVAAPHPASSSRPPKAKPSTFISSLFSGPVDAAAAAAQEEEERQDAARRLQRKKATNAPTDTSTFQGLGLDPLLVAHLKGSRMNIGNRPTGIQRTGLPALLSGDDSRDVLIHSQTGSGKTLTYLLPILQSLLPLCTETWIDRSVGTLAIILAPTRELARQIYEVAEKLCQLHLSLRDENQEKEGKTGDADADSNSDSDSDDEASSPSRRTRWLVPGLLSGGSTKNHEKSRLRKGIPILVATPGRLLDHLQNTSSFDVGKCRWLVLDEADRLFEMGFKETLEGIIKAMDGRRRLAFNTAKETMQEQRADGRDIPLREVSDGTGVPWWETPRKVVLCSATLDENVQMLAGTHLRRPQVVRGGGELPREESADTVAVHANADADAEATPSSSSPPRMSAPAQLRQHSVVVPPKLRLVTLIALLRSALASKRDASNADARRVIVFISSTDSVEFHWNALGGVKMSGGGDDDEGEGPTDAAASLSPFKTCELFPQTPIYRLHGSLAQSDRIASLKGFAGGKRSGGKTSGGGDDSDSSSGAAVLLCTSVAARGLDLPSVGCVIQLDPPTEGGVDEYLHRIGRTARVGKEGESYICFLPHEEPARARLEAAMGSGGKSENSGNSTAATPSIAPLSSAHVLKRGFGGKGTEYESRATDVQLAFERLVLARDNMAAMARRGFLSFIRAYATHPLNEKDLFHVKFLHLGHLAKSFALRETPDEIKARVKADQKKQANADRQGKAHPNAVRRDRKLAERQLREGASGGGGSVGGGNAVDANDADGDSDSDGDDYETLTAAARKSAATAAASATASSRNSSALDGITSSRKANDAEARMYAKVREMGRQIKSGGKLAAYGADEFQLG